VVRLEAKTAKLASFARRAVTHSLCTPHRQPAVHDQLGARDVFRLVGGEEQSRISPGPGRPGDKVRWREKAGMFLRDLGDGNAEVTIGSRAYRVLISDLRSG
jgi:hypothetical protein